jgi:hypothetical protein
MCNESRRHIGGPSEDFTLAMLPYGGDFGSMQMYLTHQGGLSVNLFTHAQGQFGMSVL